MSNAVETLSPCRELVRLDFVQIIYFAIKHTAICYKNKNHFKHISDCFGTNRPLNPRVTTEGRHKLVPRVSLLPSTGNGRKDPGNDFGSQQYSMGNFRILGIGLKRVCNGGSCWEYH